MIESKDVPVVKNKVSAKRKMKDRDRKQIRHGKQKIRQEIARLEETIFRRDQESSVNEAPTEVAHSSDYEEDLEDSTRIEAGSSKIMKAVAWLDEEDLSLTVDKVMSKSQDGRIKRMTALPDTASSDSYQKMLKEQFKGVFGTPQWAKLNEKVDEADEFINKVLRTSSKLLDSSGTLSANTLNYTRLVDMNEKGIVQKCLITAIDFNPISQVAAVTNQSGNATFFQVDGEKNSVVHKTSFKNFPISSAKFSANGRELLIGSEFRACMQSYDLIANKATVINSPTRGPEISSMDIFSLSGNGEYIAVAGKDGTVALLTSGTKEIIHSVKMSGRCHSLSFTADSSKLLTYGDEGKVYVWDVRQRKCLHRFIDEGCLGGLSLSLSAGDQYLACGSSSGVVNIYSGSTVLPSKDGHLSMCPSPNKAIMNLTTAAHKVVFNPTAQILAISSKFKDSALKLVHLPSFSVFANFPSKNLDLGRVETIAFSPNSGYMAVGNNIGGARLIRLHHFSNY